MNALILGPYEFARSKARHIGEVLAMSVWQEPTEQERGQVRAAQELVREALTLQDFVKDGWDLTLRLLAEGELKKIDEHGQFIRDLIDACLKVMKPIGDWAAAIGQRYGEPIRDLEEVPRAIDRLTRLREHVSTEWPRHDPERTRRRVEDVQRTGGLSLDEVFATGQGGS